MSEENRKTPRRLRTLEGSLRSLRRELRDVVLLKRAFEPKGIRGAVFDCEFCADKHYLDWDLIIEGLKHALEGGETPVLEPDPSADPTTYISWDYATGLLDGLESFTDWDPEFTVHLFMSLSGDAPIEISTTNAEFSRTTDK